MTRVSKLYYLGDVLVARLCNCMSKQSGKDCEQGCNHACDKPAYWSIGDKACSSTQY